MIRKDGIQKVRKEAKQKEWDKELLTLKSSLHQQNEKMETQLKQSISMQKNVEQIMGVVGSGDTNSILKKFGLE